MLSPFAPLIEWLRLCRLLLLGLLLPWAAVLRAADTDGDGLEDAYEASWGLNPADADSDDDGVVDGRDALALNPHFKHPRVHTDNWVVVELGPGSPVDLLDAGAVLVRNDVTVGEDVMQAYYVWQGGNTTNLPHSGDPENPFVWARLGLRNEEQLVAMGWTYNAFMHALPIFCYVGDETAYVLEEEGLFEGIDALQPPDNATSFGDLYPSDLWLGRDGWIYFGVVSWQGNTTNHSMRLLAWGGDDIWTEQGPIQGSGHLAFTLANASTGLPNLHTRKLEVFLYANMTVKYFIDSLELPAWTWTNIDAWSNTGLGWAQELADRFALFGDDATLAAGGRNQPGEPTLWSHGEPFAGHDFVDWDIEPYGEGVLRLKQLNNLGLGIPYSPNGQYWLNGWQYSPTYELPWPYSDFDFGWVTANVIARNSVTYAATWDYDPEGPDPAFQRALLVGLCDLDIDSDNNNGAGAPDRTPAEDALEKSTPSGNGLLLPGKRMAVNNGDHDLDGVVDYADGYNGRTLPEVKFTQLVVEVPAFLDKAKIYVRLRYNMSHPTLATSESQYSGGGSQPIYQYGQNSAWTTWYGTIFKPSLWLGGDGIRIWAKDADEPRTTTDALFGGDYVASAQSYPFTLLNGGGDSAVATLYVEGVHLKQGVLPGVSKICLDVDLDGPGPLDFVELDSVNYTLTDAIFAEATGGILERDDYTFATMDTSLHPLYGTPVANSEFSENHANVPIYAIAQNGSIQIKVTHLPGSALGYLGTSAAYYIGEEAWPVTVAGGCATLLADTWESPSVYGVMEHMVHNITVNSTGGRGMTFLDVHYGLRQEGEVKAGRAGVAVFSMMERVLGIRSVNLTQNGTAPPQGPNNTAPSLTTSDAAALQVVMNKIYNQCNVHWTVTILPSLNIDYDTNEDGELTPGPGDSSVGGTMYSTEESLIINAAAASEAVHYQIILVNSLLGPEHGYSKWVPQPYAFMDAWTNWYDFAHEVGHALGLPHPFMYYQYRAWYAQRNWPNVVDLDPENIMNYGYHYHPRPKLRYSQWIQINPIHLAP